MEFSPLHFISHSDVNVTNIYAVYFARVLYDVRALPLSLLLPLHSCDLTSFL